MWPARDKYAARVAVDSGDAGSPGEEARRKGAGCFTETEKQELGDDLLLEEWCRRVRALLAADPTLNIASINRSFDMSANWAGRRLHRYPPR